jgi:uncharacterized membrane-anchored protein
VKHHARLIAVLLTLAAILPLPALAKRGEDKTEINWVTGPATGTLEGWAEVKVPEGYMLANGDDTRRIMQAMGNLTSGNEVGFMAHTNIFTASNSTWFILFEFDEVGYIKDDEKKDLQADAMLESMKKQSEESNKVRRRNGFSGLTIVGWEQPPHYNEQTHNLEWSLKAKDDEGELVLNHNTRLLGRKGVMKATLVVDPSKLAEVMPDFNARIADFEFKSGQKYSEFRQGDKIAKYGLAALVAGGAAAVAVKTGLLQKLIKPILFGVAALGAFLANLFKRKNSE